ncbi:MAG: hypothetical protein ACR2KE_08760 [Candidatus Nanopelagicales bacterium]
MKTFVRRILAVTAGVTVVASAFVLAGVPAQSQEQKNGIGSGRAVIHIDAPTATVTKVGKNSYRMVLPPGSSGQWMGERTDARGKERTLVGDLNAKKLSNKWGKFRYTSAGVPATLAWGGNDGFSAALVQLSQPTLTDAGVRFDFTSRSTIPASLTDVSINLQRAPEKSRVRSTDAHNVNITGDLWIGGNVESSAQVDTRIYNASNNNTCWTGSGAKVINDSMSPEQTVTANTCASIAYDNRYAATSDYPAYGVKAVFPIPGKPNSSGSLTYLLTITPSGQAPYTYTQQLMTWS